MKKLNYNDYKIIKTKYEQEKNLNRLVFRIVHSWKNVTDKNINFNELYVLCRAISNEKLEMFYVREAMLKVKNAGWIETKKVEGYYNKFFQGYNYEMWSVK